MEEEKACGANTKKHESPSGHEKIKPKNRS